MYPIAKRTFDLAVSASGLVVLAPVLAVLAAAIRLAMREKALFKQERPGYLGRPFTLLKFRTMRTASDRGGHTLPDRQRLTAIGRFLRSASLDELPELWNVLKGDMSLVGPRPAVPGEVENYKGWQRRRLRMRPGLTCLWAVEGRDHLDFETWMKLDMQYIDNWSLSLDCKILLLTIPHVLIGKGAH